MVNGFQFSQKDLRLSSGYAFDLSLLQIFFSLTEDNSWTHAFTVEFKLLPVMMVIKDTDGKYVVLVLSSRLVSGFPWGPKYPVSYF